MIRCFAFNDDHQRVTIKGSPPEPVSRDFLSTALNVLPKRPLGSEVDESLSRSASLPARSRRPPYRLAPRVSSTPSAICGDHTPHTGDYPAPSSLRYRHAPKRDRFVRPSHTFRFALASRWSSASTIASMAKTVARSVGYAPNPTYHRQSSSGLSPLRGIKCPWHHNPSVSRGWVEKTQRRSSRAAQHDNGEPKAHLRTRTRV